ncbi:cryptochrome/photolyase family protein [SAR86 cluster bacterium]|nr:cryptochrome/photolyase family protein [SAR86 cluster bacterium]
MADHSLLIILGNQLFPIEEIKKTKIKKIFIKEDLGLCTNYKHHKLKILFFLSAMRQYRDLLLKNGYEVIYHSIDDKSFELAYLKVLKKEIKENKISNLAYFEIEDNEFQTKFINFIQDEKIDVQEFKSPMFLCGRDEFKDFFGNKNLRMVSFYQMMRKKLNLLMDGEKPQGGKWSFDAENRKKLPKGIEIPDLPKLKTSEHVSDLSTIIEKKFSNHPGEIKNVWFPTNRSDSLKWLKNFLENRFSLFGDYEDAIDSEHNFIFHSALSPLLNIGLLTPNEIIDEVMNYSKKNDVPLNSLEGFIRQIIGWREFIRGTYYLKGKEERESNFFNHQNKLTEAWYTGETGIPPLDKAIKDCLAYGYTHHIPRLMIISNLMTLSRIHPEEIYKWFMEMFIDSSEWVMVPNVFGMGTFADGGIFATKPYSCGSNYLLKMSNYKKGPWCDVVDGLYWQFMSDNRDFFASNPRLSILPRSLDRMKPERKKMIFNEADNFINLYTSK